MENLDVRPLYFCVQPDGHLFIQNPCEACLDVGMWMMYDDSPYFIYDHTVGTFRTSLYYDTFANFILMAAAVFPGHMRFNELNAFLELDTTEIVPDPRGPLILPMDTRMPTTQFAPHTNELLGAPSIVFSTRIVDGIVLARTAPPQPPPPPPAPDTAQSVPSWAPPTPALK